MEPQGNEIDNFFFFQMKCANTELRSWLVTVGVEENFFHQQNWREHKERNLDEKRVSLTKSCPIPNSPKIWQNMIYSLLHIIIYPAKNKILDKGNLARISLMNLQNLHRFNDAIKCRALAGAFQLGRKINELSEPKF